MFATVSSCTIVRALSGVGADASMWKAAIVRSREYDGSVWKPLGSKANAPGSGEAQAFTGEKAAIRCFPNPAHSALFVEYQLPTDGAYSLYVRNLQGQLVQTFAANETKPAGAYRLELNAAAYEGGLYMLTLQTAKGAL